ncbi:MAG: transcription antitermination factor NusB [Candidatus Accumulibacter sp.]|jgi:N utilization substance protein B|nr:transcription antitermination factor NusB [Accumulibacter sp.]
MNGAAQDRPSRAAKSANSPRRRAREFVLQGLYQWQLSGCDEAFIEAQLSEAPDFDKADRKFFAELLHGVLVQRVALQEAFQVFLDRPCAELSPVEAGVLLIGAYELAHCPQTPYRVVINEAIELAKGFGGADGHKYVNGVLDKLAATLRTAEVDAKRASSRKP